MDKFVIRIGKDGASAVNSPDHPSLDRSKNPRQAPQLKSMRCFPHDYQVRGAISPWQKRRLGRLTLMSYREICRFKQFSSNSRTRVADAERLDMILARAETSSIVRELYHITDGRDLPPSVFGPSACVSCIDFDSKGIYLAAVNTARVLTIHEFESLHVNTDIEDTRTAPEILINFSENILQAVRWNPGNEDEVACVGLGSHNVAFYDVASCPERPSQILRVKPVPNVLGLHDLKLCKYGSSRVLACGRDGTVHIWDRRASNQSNASLPVPRSLGSLNSLQLSSDEQVVLAGSDGGYVHTWDLRGGKRSATLVSCREGEGSVHADVALPILTLEEILGCSIHMRNHATDIISGWIFGLCNFSVYHEPLGAVKLSAALSSVSSLTAQTRIEPSAVQTIAVNPSCGHQIAFHLYNGWSGVVDMATSEITHLYAPPPFLHDVERFSMEAGAFRDEPPPFSRFLAKRRPAWINSLSVFAVPSTTSREHSIHMLDFSSGPESHHHVAHECSSKCEHKEQSQVKVSASEQVVSVATHPLNDELVAGTSEGKLLLIGKRQGSSREEDSDVGDKDEV